MAAPENPGLRGPFPNGMNNRVEDFALGQGELRNAVNVDVLSSGHIRRRTGYEQVLGMPGVHSGWSNNQVMLCVADTTLYRIDLTPTGLVATGLHFGLTPGLPMAYVDTPQGVLYSNGVVRGHLLPNGATQAWGVAVPASEVALAEVDGQLHAGQYQVTYTYVRASGEESGAPASTAITVGEDAGLVVSGFATPLDPSVTAINIYGTQQNGTEQYLWRSVPPTTLTVTLTGAPQGRTLPPQPLVPMPAGNVLELHGARVFSALGAVVTFSEEWAYGRTHPLRNMLAFPTPVTLMASVPDGLYVVADRTYFFAGFDPAKFVPQVVLPYGGVRGTLLRFPNSTEVGWFSHRGFVVADSGGKIGNVQESRVAVEQATIGAATFREHDGVRQLIGTLMDPNANTAVSQSFMDAEVFRKGTRL